GVAEAAPVAGRQRRLIAVGPEPHVGRGRRVLFQGRLTAVTQRPVGAVRDDLVLGRHPAHLAERTPGPLPTLRLLSHNLFSPSWPTRAGWPRGAIRPGRLRSGSGPRTRSVSAPGNGS